VACVYLHPPSRSRDEAGRRAGSALNWCCVYNFINLIFFQAAWFLTVTGAASGHHWIGPAGLATFMLVHAFISNTTKADYALVAFAIVIGLIVETWITRAGLLVYAHSLMPAQWAPIWILVLWANFALTMNGCLRWLQGRYLLAAALGSVGGPLSYWGGVQLGAATAIAPLPAILLPLAVIYALITPLLLLAASRLPFILAETD
jgi:hypothetical protein